MKKYIIELSIIVIFIVSILTISCLGLVINLQEKDYFVPEISQPDKIPDQPDYNNFLNVAITEETFPIYTKTIDTAIYYDSEISYKNIQIADTTRKIGDKVYRGSSLGQYNGNNILATEDCIVVEFTPGNMKVKVLSEIYADFSYNIYSTDTYEIGDKFDVYKNYKVVTTATIVDLDFTNIQSDRVNATVKIDNSKMYFQSITSINLVKQGYKTFKSNSIQSTVLNIHDNSLQYKNITRDGIVKINGEVLLVTIRFGYSFNGYIQIEEILHDNTIINYDGGTLYVRINN